MMRNAVDEVRRIQMDLRPSILDDFGIEVTLNWFCREFQKVYSTIQIEKKIGIEEDEVPQSLKVTIYRIIQEAFNNIAKHSKGSHVVLSLEKNHSMIALAVQDNGQGFDPEEVLKRHRKNMGLSSMKERTELSGGTFCIQSEIGKGTSLSFTWPRPEQI
jgi:signal transduction histidine kinase